MLNHRIIKLVMTKLKILKELTHPLLGFSSASLICMVRISGNHSKIPLKKNLPLYYPSLSYFIFAAIYFTSRPTEVQVVDKSKLAMIKKFLFFTRN